MNDKETLTVSALTIRVDWLLSRGRKTRPQPN